MKKILSVALCAAMLLCAAVPVFGAETTGSVVEPGDATAEAVVTAVGCAFSVTVPSALPVSVNSMGDVFVANNAKIVNESAGAVEVKDVQFAPANGWAAVAFDKDFVGLAMNLKEIGFIINAHGTAHDN